MTGLSRISRTLLKRPRVTALKRPRGLAAVMMLAALAITGTIALWPSAPASAHCDSVNGPVVAAAKASLEKNDVKLVLPYVKPAQEQELTSAFKQTVAIRQRGAEVREVADHYFYETAVRLHRIGEGASYTGLKDEPVTDPALIAAEKSLEQGNPDEVITVLDNALRTKVAERYQHVLEARAAEAANPTVETARERVEAELMFEKYVLELNGAINAAAHEEAGAGEGGHEH